MNRTPSFTSLLAILQQHEYDWQYFVQWYTTHPHIDQEITPQKWTTKLRFVAAMSNMLFFLPPLQRIYFSLWVFSPFEKGARILIHTLAYWKLRWLKMKGLKVVAIAGSYGKTSTKHILTHTLSTSITVLATEKSINTPLGIAQVILRQLNTKHQLFIVEMGEYYPGDIAQLCRFVQPDFGILTPVGRQHLERFGNLENIVATMFELVTYFGERTDHCIVAEQYMSHTHTHKISTFGAHPTCTYFIDQAKVTRAGTEFTIHTPRETFSTFIPLFGVHQAVNTLPAFWLADQLQLEYKKIMRSFTTLPYIPHRHEPTFAPNNVLILDNGYNTNPDSIRASLKLINQIEATNRIIITLGFVELGAESDALHRELGRQLAHDVDYVGIIQSPNTAAIRTGYLSAGGHVDHFLVGKDQADLLTQLQKYIIPKSVILLEGGVREIYT